ncbi:MAG: hypothetical protein AAB660_01375 [Patescibacteria group bacterium]
MKIFNKSLEKGQVVLAVVTLFLMVSLTMVLGVSGPVFRGQKSVSDLLESRQTYFLAEAGVEDVAYRLSHGVPYSANGQILSIDGHTVTIDTTTVSGKKVITATSDWNGNQRKIEAKLAAGDGVAFYYGVQIGQGGFTIGNNSGINGSVYSNGNISGGNGSYITGTAVAVGEIDNVDVGRATTSDAWAREIESISATGNLYCQTGAGNNKPCNTSKGIPPAVGYPISSQEITDWQNDALVGGTFVGTKTISTSGSLGPLKIQGNLQISDGKTLTVTGTLWVTGSIILGNDAAIRLTAGYGTSGGVVLTDGKIQMGNNVTLAGSGTAGSFLIMLSQSSAPDAIQIGNGNTTEVILYAQNGAIIMGNNANVRSLTAKTITLGNNTILTYTQGLLDAVFNSGPSGGYQLSSWLETN